jgi:MraZ protein
LIFRGTFEHALDAKHRLTVPAKFRAALAAGVVLAASPETTAAAPRSIAIWTAESYEAYAAAALQGLSPLSPEARDMKRFFFNYSQDTELDSANRVMIPPMLLEYAGLDKDVVVTGSGECLEVFDRSKYTGYSEDVLIRVPDIAAKLGHTP